MTEKQPIFFIKFGNEKNMKDLLENGIIFCRQIDDLRKRGKENKAGGDILEGVLEIKNIREEDKPILTILDKTSSKEIKISLNKAQIREYANNIGNIYSIYSINLPEIKEEEILLNKKMLKYGTHAIFIRDIGEFLKRIKKEAIKRNLNINWGLVDYYDASKKEVKNLTCFDKSIENIHESEFRIYIPNSKSEKLVLNIGNIEDIADIYKSEEFMKMRITIKNSNDKLNFTYTTFIR